MRQGEAVFRCTAHGYEVRAWRFTVCAKPGRTDGCLSCATAFRSALDAIRYGRSNNTPRKLRVLG